MKIENCFSLGYTNGGYGNYFYQSWGDTNMKNFYVKEELLEYKNKIKSILLNSGDGKMGKILYVGKGSSVPRHKIKMFVEENKIKKTTIIENSDTVVFDKKLIHDLYKWFDVEKEVTIGIVPFTKELMENITLVNSLSNRHQSHQFDDYLLDAVHTKKSLVIYQHDWINYPNEIQKAIGNVEWNVCLEQNTYRIKNLQDLFDTLEYYFTNPHGNIIWDDNILERLNSDGIDLDEEYLETLRGMFSSGDQGNIKLAIEMLSNVNLEKHGLTIALLLNRWKDRMSWGQGNTYSQAFKTLDRYFRNKGIDWKKDFRSLGADLYNNYKKEEDREIISRFVIDNLNKYLGYSQKDNILQISDFKLELCKKG